ncbi:MAG: XTP/dITP diphosphatase [candidate division Zixibacteria bacterium]|nr:XTP/dITP diphosphatase [candidate division Zixibacteria bacterium]
MNLVLATNNDDKIKEIKYLLEDLPVTIFSRSDFLEFPDVEETGQTLKENALLKAKAVAEYCDMPALADDTGLEVDALDGAPGIYSARYAGDNVSYADNVNKLIKEMKDVPQEKRTARFRCVIAIDWNDGNIETVEGLCEGFITEDIQGDQGFGYDPVFYYPPKDKRFSQMTIEEKNMVSHRGLALQNMVGLIMEKVNKLRAAQSGE